MKNLHRIKSPFIIFIFTLLFFFSLSNSVHAVSEAAVLFLLISPSPVANGMGQTFGNISSAEPMASFFNPAYLGFFSKNQNFGVSYSETNWLPQLANDLYYKCFSLNFGYSLKKAPITLGIGYHHVHLDLGKVILTNLNGEIIGYSDSNEKADGLSFSVLFDYYVLASLGVGYKFIESNLVVAPEAIGVDDIKASATAYDFGLALKFPVFDIFSKITDHQIYSLPNFIPFLIPGFSYSVNNIGDEISYIDETQADPLPRMVYTGINMAAGLKYTNTNHPFNILSFRWAQEANDLLVHRAGENTKYSSGFKDIDFVENVLLGKSNEKIITNSGWELGFAEIFYLRKGSCQDIEEYIHLSSDGWSINFMQPIRLMFEFSNFKKKELWFKFLNNLDIEFNHSEFHTDEGHPLDDTRFNGITIKMKNMFIW